MTTPLQPPPGWRRYALVLLVIALVVVPVAVGASHQFSDVPDSHPFHAEITWLADNGITTGFPDGTFRPSIPVTRQAMAAFLKRLAEAGVVDAGTLDGLDSTDFLTTVANVVWVSADGSAGANGAALLAAVAGISGASPTNPFLVKVGPGVYDLGGVPLQLKAWVDIEGSGQDVTLIRSVGGPDLATGATIWGADNAELRHLTVANVGTAPVAVGVYNLNVSPSLLHVTVIAENGAGTATGVYSDDSMPRLTSVTVEALSNVGRVVGVLNRGAHAVMTDVTASAVSNGGGDAVGVENEISSASTMTDVTAQGTVTAGVFWGYGVINSSGAIPTLVDVRATGISTSPEPVSVGVGVNNILSAPDLTGVVAHGESSGFAYGIRNEGAVPVIRNSQVSAVSTAISYGVSNEVTSGTPSSVDIFDSEISASGSFNTYGVYSDDSALRMRRTSIEATSSSSTLSARGMAFQNLSEAAVSQSTVLAANIGGGAAIAVETLGNGLLDIDNSQLFGVSNTISNGGYTVNVGGTLLSGGLAANISGTLTCAGVWDELYVFSAGPGCP